MGDTRTVAGIGHPQLRAFLVLAPELGRAGRAGLAPGTPFGAHQAVLHTAHTPRRSYRLLIVAGIATYIDDTAHKLLICH